MAPTIRRRCATCGSGWAGSSWDCPRTGPHHPRRSGGGWRRHRLMKDTLHPNLADAGGQPAFVHAGPSPTSPAQPSILADRMALHLGDYVVTESGFGADMGMEKFFDIKCRVIRPATGLCRDGRDGEGVEDAWGGPKVVAGRPLDSAYTEENLPLLRAGMANLKAHLDIAAGFECRSWWRSTDSPPTASTSWSWSAVGAGGVPGLRSSPSITPGGGRACTGASSRRGEQPAEPVRLSSIPSTARSRRRSRPSPPRSIGRVGRVHTAGGDPDRRLRTVGIRPFTDLHGQDPPLDQRRPFIGRRPHGYELTVREVRASVGAGFIYPLLGEMSTMPGLGAHRAS